MHALPVFPLTLTLTHSLDSFLTAGQDPNEPNNAHLRPCQLAAANDRKEIAELLIANGADIALGKDCLPRASARTHISMAGCCPSGDHFGRTPLHAAALRGHVRMVKVLILNGADVYITDRYEETPLHAACAAGNVDVSLTSPPCTLMPHVLTHSTQSHPPVLAMDAAVLL